MLEQLRRNSRSWLIWFIFAVIILAFVLFFGPQSGPDMFGCGQATQSVVAEVSDDDISVNSWRFAMNGLGFGSGGSGPQAAAKRATAIDFLVERQLLASEAERAGFRVPNEMVEKRIAEGEFYILGQKVDGTQIYFDGTVFNFDFLERYAQQLGLPSVDYFIEEQRLEIMANMTREVLARAAVVSDEEARAEYIHRNTTITADYLQFEVAAYRRALELGEADALAYLEDHQDEVKKKWEVEKAQFSSAKDRVLTRHILIEKGEGDGAAAKERAEAIRSRIEGGEDFAEVAAEVSGDQRTRPRGGLVGWKVADTLGYGSEVSEAVKKLEVGQVSQVLESPTGYHLFKVEKRSSEGLTFEDRKLEIAFALATDHYARELARRDAEAALARVKAAEKGTDLEDLYERASPEPAPGGPGAPQLSPEQMEQIRKQIEEGMKQPGSESGWIYREGEVVLAQAGGQPAAEPEPAAAEPATAEPATAGPAAAKEPAADRQGLPALDIEPPELRQVGPVSRPPDKLAGVGRSDELIKALFEELEEGEIAGRVFEVSDPEAFVIVELASREQADLDQFEAERGEIRERLEQLKAVELILSWIRSRCEQAAESGDITVNPSFLTPDEDTPPMPYSACANISELSVYRQLASRQPDQLGFF